MLFNPMIPSRALYQFCHAMARMLEAGVDVRRALKTAARSTTNSRIVHTVENVVRRVKSGGDMTSAFREFPENYPRLFLDLLNVGEQTGALPEVMSALGDYYEARVARIREFRSAITWPMLQLVAAIMIIGLLIWLLGIITESRPGIETVDILGLGLVGTRGALIWFVLCFGTLGGIWLNWKVISRTMAGHLFLDPLLMKIPGFGHCIKSFAIARFAWCFALTQQAGMSIRPSLTSSLNATANGAFIAANPTIWNEVDAGETLGHAFRSAGLFPDEFLHFVDTAEVSGTVPEAMDRMSHHFDAEAHRALKWLTVLLARSVWALVALLIVFFIFRIAMFYIGMTYGALQEIGSI